MFSQNQEVRSRPWKLDSRVKYFNTYRNMVYERTEYIKVWDQGRSLE
jgi:hypothetical protein